LGHEVILVIAPDVRTDPLGRDTLRDARLLAKERHPNLAIVFGAACRHGRAGVWLEAVDCEALESALAHVGRFSAREAALIGVDVCAPPFDHARRRRVAPRPQYLSGRAGPQRSHRRHAVRGVP
jgi:hypothetical protein